MIELIFLLAGLILGLLFSHYRIRKVTESASTDTLTGLYNRALLDKMLGRLHSAAVRDKRSLSILMIDLNHFKEANDRFGHQFGDQVLKSSAGAMVSSLRGADFIFRYGGDEFIVILPGTSSVGALRVAKKIKSKLEEITLATPNGRLFQDVEASIGIASFPEITGDEIALLKAADEAVYLAKDTKRHIEVAKQ